MCQRVELKVSASSQDKVKFKCPRCNKEYEYTYEEIEEIEKEEQEEVAESVLDEATTS